MSDWGERLELGSSLHLVTLAVCLATMAALARLGRRASERGERVLRLAWAGGIVALQLVFAWRYWHPARFDAATSLPLHLCDLTVLIAAAALATDVRALRALLYFWALALSTQAFVTPIVRVGCAHADYWFFWIYHAQLVGAAVYEVAVRGFRPTRRDFVTASLGLVAYGALVLPLDLAFGWNYGFLGPGELPETALDVLPPWPWRLLVFFAAAELAMALLWLVAALFARKRP